MNKNVGIAAIVTMFIATGYILYSDFTTNTKNVVLPVDTESISTSTKETEEIKPVVKNMTPVNSKTSVYTLELGDSIDVYGLAFKQPLNWNLEREKNISADPGYVFTTRDFIPAEIGSIMGANDNDIKTGLRISIANQNAKVDDSIATPEAFRDFQLKNMKDCSNCSGYKSVLLNNVPAIINTSKADNYGGSTGYTGFYNGRIFSVMIEYPDNYEAHEELFSKFISEIKFTN